KSRPRDRLQHSGRAAGGPRPRHAADGRDRNVDIVHRRRLQCASPSWRRQESRGRAHHHANAPCGGGMSYLVWLVPIALGMGMAGLTAFLWSMRSGQYDDLDGAAERVLIAEATDQPLQQDAWMDEPRAVRSPGTG